MDSSYNKSKFVRFPKMEHFSDVFGIPTEKEVHVDTSFFVSEKIDGANIGIYIPLEGEVSSFSRNGENADGGLFSYKVDKECLEGLISELRPWMKKHQIKFIYLWGEYFGQHVCRRIGYKGPLGQFKFFDGFMEVEDEEEEVRLTPPFMIALREYFSHYEDFFIPYHQFHNISFLELKERLPLPCQSGYSLDPMEGYVISEVAEDGTLVGRWKYKDPAFKDHAAKKKVEASQNPEAIPLHEAYLTYINKNRMLDYLSKTTERVKLDSLVRGFINDAKEDFIKTYSKELAVLTDKEMKYVMSAGKTPFELLKECLKEEKYAKDSGDTN